MGNGTKLSVISGAAAMADGLTHVGLSVDVRVGDEPATVIIPDCNPLSGVTTVYVDKPIKLELEKLEALLSAHGLKNETVKRFLRGTSLSCDAFYFTCRNPKSPRELHSKSDDTSQPVAADDKDKPVISNEMLDKATKVWEAANPAPLLMQFAVDFDQNEDKANRDLAVANAYFDTLNALATKPEKLEELKTLVKNANDQFAKLPKESEKACKAASDALAKAKEIASTVKPKVELDGAMEKKIDDYLASDTKKQHGGLIKSLTNSSALSQLFEVEKVKVRMFRCGESWLPVLKDYAAELEGKPPVAAAKLEAPEPPKSEK